MRYLALIIATIVFVGVSVAADDMTITKNLGTLVPGDIVYYNTEFSV